METNTEIKIYYIQASVICNDWFEEIFWDEGYWARISTNDINDVISVANKICNKMYDRRLRMSRDPRLIIDLVTDYDRDQGVSVHQQLYIKIYPDKVHVKDLSYDKEKKKVTFEELEDLCCYRDDLSDNLNQLCDSLSESSDNSDSSI